MINWKVRLKQKWFWMTVIPAAIIFVQEVAMVFGWQLDLQELQGRLVAAVDAGLTLAAILGITIDLTTEGLGDSAKALTYEKPAPNAAAYGLQEYREQCAAADAKMVNWSAPIVGTTEEFDFFADEEAEDGNR